MEQYNYYDAVYDDVTDYIKNEIYFDEYETVDDMEEDIRERCEMSDSVTGNMTGSYHCNTWKAEECLCHNLNELMEALDYFGYDVHDVILNGPEWFDVIMRIYYVGQVLPDVLDTEFAEEVKEVEQRESED